MALIFTILFTTQLLALSAHAMSTSCTTGDVAAAMNLTAIPPLSIDLPQLYQNEENVFTWTVSLCSPVLPAAGKGAACQDPFNLSHPDVVGYVIENRHDTCETTWTTIQSISLLGTDGVQFVYGQRPEVDNHPGWTAVLDVTCGSTVALQPQARVVTVEGDNLQALQFYFQFTSSVVCSPASGTPFQCGGGCAFLGALVVGAFFYFLGMVMYQCIAEGKRGRDVLPHPHFWSNFAGLVKEGVVYTFYSFTCRRVSRGNAYIVHRGIVEARMGENNSAGARTALREASQTSAADYEELR